MLYGRSAEGHLHHVQRTGLVGKGNTTKRQKIKKNAWQITSCVYALKRI